MIKTGFATAAPSRAKRATRPTSLVAKVLTLLAITRERHALHTLDEHLLQDIGKTRNEVEREARRPIWDAPNRWMR